MDQLSINKFDVEHIAPKDQMKKLIAATEGIGLPISSIANLCYLPEYVNRSKRDKNFYQDTKYLQHIDLDEVEKKYSFTTREDLEWMDMPYQSADDFEALKQFYVEFCNDRFEILKKLFCESMGIDYEAMNSLGEETSVTPESKDSETVVSKTNTFVSECVKEVEEKFNIKLDKVSRSAYVSTDGKKGYIICVSKAYKQGNREKYWFGYRRNPLEDIKKCEEKYIIYGCRDSKEILVVPVDYIEELTSSMNYSLEDGEISHWHVVFFRDSNGYMTQMLSKPSIEEIDINSYKL